MNMVPNPSYATDKQLRGMAQGGLPSAVNEEIMRLSMRRGAQVVPQPPAVPGVQPPEKMKPKDMINDFISRVKAQNESNKNSLVPAGTPMQQPQPQPQGGPQPRPQGIAGYASGGVRGFQKGGANDHYRNPSMIGPLVAPSPYMSPMGSPFYNSPTDTPLPSDPPTPPPANPDKLGRSDALQDLMAMDAEGFYGGDANPPTPAAKVNPFGYTPADQAYLDMIRQDQSAASQSGIAAALPEEASVSASANSMKSGPDMSGVKRPVMGKAPELPAFTPSQFVDPVKARADAIAAGQGEIDAQVKPFDDIANEAQGDLEESKRSSFWNAVLKASMVAMQAGGPSSDPASADIFSIAGKSLEGYVGSLEKDKAYQDKIKAEIRGYKVAGSQARAQATNSMGQVGITSAQMQNNHNIVGDQITNSRDLAAYNADNDRVSRQYAGDVNMYGAELQARVDQWKATVSSKAGMDPLDFMKAFAAVGEDASKSVAAKYGSEFAADPKNAELIRQEEGAYRSAAQASFIMSRFLANGERISKEDAMTIVQQMSDVNVGFAAENIDTMTPDGKTVSSSRMPAAPTPYAGGAMDIRDRFGIRMPWEGK